MTELGGRHDPRQEVDGLRMCTIVGESKNVKNVNYGRAFHRRTRGNGVVDRVGEKIDRTYFDRHARALGVLDRLRRL